VILDPVNIKSEIKILRTEISTLEQGDSEQKKLAKQKSKKLEALSDYLEAYDNHNANKSKSSINEQGQIIIPFDDQTVNPLEKAYKNYVKTIADVTGDFVFEDDITNSFRKVMDYYDLNEDSKNYGRIINSLANPALLQRYAANIHSTLKSLYENRNEVVGDSIDGFMNTAESTALINSLAKMNVIIEPDQLRELINNGVTPTDFFDSVTNKEIEKGSAKDIAVQAALETYFEIKRQSMPSVDTNTVDTPVVSDTEADTQFGNDMLSDLKQLSSDKGKPSDTENKVQINVPETGTPVVTSTESVDIEAKKAEADKLTPIEQNFADGQGGRKMQSKFAGKSTMDLILSGDRTRTTRANTDIQRMLKDYGLTKIEDLVGKVIRMTDKKGRTVYTEITKVAPFTKEYQDATWQKEGWEKEVTDKLVGQYPYAIEFKLAALEGTDTVQTSEQSSIKKVQDMLDAVTSLKELPDPKFSDGKGITMDLMEMIAGLEITADEVKKAVEKRRVELIKNLSINDLQNGDLVTFTDGKKGVIISVGEKNIKVKVFGPKSYKEVIISGDAVSKTFTMVEKGKIASSQEIIEEPIITEEDKVEVEASKDNLDAYRENAANVKKAGQEAAKLAGKDNAANLNNLFNNIGCKTK
jgi:preprotein translocase subunit YajC